MSSQEKVAQESLFWLKLLGRSVSNCYPVRFVRYRFVKLGNLAALCFVNVEYFLPMQIVQSYCKCPHSVITLNLHYVCSADITSVHLTA